MVEIKEKLVFCISFSEFLALENMSNFRTLHFRIQTQQQKKTSKIENVRSKTVLVLADKYFIPVYLYLDFCVC